MQYVDSLLNKITMYRLVLYFLIALVAISILLGFTNTIPYGGFDIFLTTLIAILSCYISNLIFAKLFKATTNVESVFVTGLIIALIFPVAFPLNVGPLLAVSIIAMASKYLLTIDKRHLFNPAAIAVLVVGNFAPDYSAIWWVGSSVLIVPVFIGGFLVMRKTRREDLVLSFLATFLIISGIGSFINNGSINSIFTVWKQSFLSSALFFFAFIMLTEPLTSPATKKFQRLYAVIVAVFYTTPLLRLGGFAFTPEIALVLGNIFSFIVSPKYRLSLTIQKKTRLNSDTYLYDFGQVKNFNFIPGQYLEWTLPHPSPDSRGNRRYFSIASGKKENLLLAVKFYEPSSSYKKALQNLKEGDKLIATGLAGDFVLPQNSKIPLVFIAGGIGITPFRSMIKDIIENQRQVDISVIFANKGIEDIFFKDDLERARLFGVKTFYVLTDKNKTPSGWAGLTGHIDTDVIKKLIPDFQKRVFYISGPQLMVQNFEKMLRDLGVKNGQLKSDFFPGYSETGA